jgi:hypothetical protein
LFTNTHTLQHTRSHTGGFFVPEREDVRPGLVQWWYWLVSHGRMTCLLVLVRVRFVLGGWGAGGTRVAPRPKTERGDGILPFLSLTHTERTQTSQNTPIPPPPPSSPLTHNPNHPHHTPTPRHHNTHQVGAITSAGEHAMTMAIEQLWRAKALMLHAASLDADSLVAPGADAARWWAWPCGLLLSVGFTLVVTLLAV